MSRREKLLQKITAAPKNATLRELRALMKLYGFVEKDTQHGFIFKHDKLKTKRMPHVSRPHGRENKVRPTYVNQCLIAIEQLLEF